MKEKVRLKPAVNAMTPAVTPGSGCDGVLAIASKVSVSEPKEVAVM